MALIKKRLYERILEKKDRLDNYRPTSQEIMNAIKKEQLVSFTYNSNALEGITLSIQETRDVISEFYDQ